MSEPRTIDQLVDAYFLHYRLTSGTREERHRAMSDACVWARETVDDLVRESPEDAWPVIQRLIAKAPDDSSLAYIGAGPLEDFVRLHGARYLPSIALEARRSEPFRRSLAAAVTPDDRTGRQIGRIAGRQRPR